MESPKYKKESVSLTHENYKFQIAK